MLSEMSCRERKVPYHFIYMWNLNTKQMNKHENRNRNINTEEKQVVAGGKEDVGMSEIKRYKLLVTKWVRRVKCTVWEIKKKKDKPKCVKTKGLFDKLLYTWIYYTTQKSMFL